MEDARCKSSGGKVKRLANFIWGVGLPSPKKSGWPGIKSLIAMQKSFSAGQQLGGETKAGWDQARSGPSLQPRWMWEVDSRTPFAA